MVCGTLEASPAIDVVAFMHWQPVNSNGCLETPLLQWVTERQPTGFKLIVRPCLVQDGPAANPSDKMKSPADVSVCIVSHLRVLILTLFIPRKNAVQYR